MVFNRRERQLPRFHLTLSSIAPQALRSAHGHAVFLKGPAAREDDFELGSVSAFSTLQRKAL